jgi:hypothetical protein
MHVERFFPGIINKLILLHSGKVHTISKVSTSIGGGCDKSIFTVQNTVNYFLRRKTSVYMVTLDASVAFDRVNTYALLSK